MLEIAGRYSGHQAAGPDAHIARDLGIAGGDAVEFLDELEEVFGVDLKPLIERGPYERNSYLHLLVGIERRRSGVDVTCRDIAAFIDERLNRSTAR